MRPRCEKWTRQTGLFKISDFFRTKGRSSASGVVSLPGGECPLGSGKHRCRDTRTLHFPDSPVSDLAKERTRILSQPGEVTLSSQKGGEETGVCANIPDSEG